MISFFKSNHRLLRGFDDLPPWFSQPNCTDTYHPPFCYLIASLYRFRKIVEIGVDKGYGAYMLATAAKECGHPDGEYLGVDILPVWTYAQEPFGMPMDRWFEGEMLPVRFLQADTLELKELPIEWIDLAYIDGRHETKWILHEVYNLILPKCKKGWSYICLDDVVDMGAQDAWAILCEDTANFEHLKFHPNGGFGILRVKETASCKL